MTQEEFLNLKIGNKIRKIGWKLAVYTVVNNDPPGNILLIPGRGTKIATRPVHPETWEFDPDQSEESRAEWRRNRDQSNETVRRMGFTPAEEAGSVILPDGSNESLQWQWRKQGCRRNPAEILPAVIDGLTQEGVSAWPGDATSIIAQMIQTQYDRAEEALKEVERLRKIIAESWGESGEKT